MQRHQLQRRHQRTWRSFSVEQAQVAVLTGDWFRLGSCAALFLQKSFRNWIRIRLQRAQRRNGGVEKRLPAPSRDLDRIKTRRAVREGHVDLTGREEKFVQETIRPFTSEMAGK